MSLLNDDSIAEDKSSKRTGNPFHTQITPTPAIPPASSKDEEEEQQETMIGKRQFR